APWAGEAWAPWEDEGAALEGAGEGPDVEDPCGADPGATEETEELDPTRYAGAVQPRSASLSTISIFMQCLPFCPSPYVKKIQVLNASKRM
ncbi:unnamed protein product, partial [Ixodes pacificus]